MNTAIGLEGANILMVDDDNDILRSLNILLKSRFSKVFLCTHPKEMHSVLHDENIDILLLDMNFDSAINDGSEGFHWMQKALEMSPDTAIVIMTAYGNTENAVRAIKEGATDFITKPWNNDKLLSTLRAAYELKINREKLKELSNENQFLKADLERNYHEIIAESSVMKDILAMVKQVAKTDANILITGENGTGKELLAREIHRRSLRKNGVFLAVDMGALHENLFESELFGHKKGAFTDANQDKTGRFVSANGGSLFLDEIGNINLNLQAKLLQVIQNRKVFPLGSDKAQTIDIRLISATNKELNQMIKDHFFREDLYYRIKTVEIHLPPLRERGQDIVLLAEHFLRQYKAKYHKHGIKLNNRIYDKLMNHSWPGNIRELQHIIEKAVILCNTDNLSIENFSFPDSNLIQRDEEYNLESLEARTIKKVLSKTKGNMTQAARILGITRPTLYNKTKKYEL